MSVITGDPRVTDAYGHGTHVAGIIAGNAAAANGVAPEFAGGIAPGAHLVNVRVLGADGSGLTSDVIAGIEWVVANRMLYNIRIINLSVGHPATEACSTDPLCEAVNQAVQAGRVCRRRRERRQSPDARCHARQHFVSGNLPMRSRSVR